MKYNLRKIISEILQEYSADQRLPFDDDQFKNKNYLEQYTDWLEDFGKYGELPPSKLDFWKELEKAAKYIVGTNLHGRYDTGLYGENYEEILRKIGKTMKGNLQFNNDGNLYVEREIALNNDTRHYNTSDKNGKDPKILYNTLVKNYNNNVGGCWSYKQGASRAYCAEGVASNVVLKGFIRIDDIDFVKTILLGFNYEGEYEIRVKPNAKVELIEVVFDCKYKIPLRGHLIVSATYFGNNSGYRGDYAPIDDGFGNVNQWMDRNGKIVPIEYAIKKIVSSGEDLKKMFKYSGDFHNGFARLFLNGKSAFVSKNGDFLKDSNGNILWFLEASDFFNNHAKVYFNGKYTLINTNGEFLRDNNNILLFDEIGEFEDGIAIVTLNEKQSFVNVNGKIPRDENGNILWFDWVSGFRYGLTVVENNNKFMFMDRNFNYIKDKKSGNLLVFDYVEYDSDGRYIVNFDWYGDFWMDSNLNFYDDETLEPIQLPSNNANESVTKLNIIIKESINSYLYNQIKKVGK